MSTPNFDRLSGKDRRCRAFIWPPAVVTTPTRAGPVGGPSWCICMLFARSFRCSLSLSWWRKVGLPLALWQEFGPNFKGLPKVSGVTTNYWVFLRCDWSHVSSWFWCAMKIRSSLVSSIRVVQRKERKKGDPRPSSTLSVRPLRTDEITAPWTCLALDEHVSTRYERKRTVPSQVQPLWNADSNNLTSIAVMEVTSEPFGLLNNRNCYQSNRSSHAI